MRPISPNRLNFCENLNLNIFLLLLESWVMSPLPQSTNKVVEVLDTMKEGKLLLLLLLLFCFYFIYNNV